MECWLLHDGPTHSGASVFCSCCVGHGHGLYCHSLCLQLLLVLYIHWNLFAHLPSLLLFLTAILFCFGVCLVQLPCSIVLICCNYLLFHAWVCPMLDFCFWDCLFGVCLIFCAWLCLCETLYSWHHVVYLALLKMALMYVCVCMYYYVQIIAICRKLHRCGAL